MQASSNWKKKSYQLSVLQKLLKVVVTSVSQLSSCRRRQWTRRRRPWKSSEIPEAIRKGKEDAMKKLVSVAINENGSITHDYVGKFGSAEVLLKKAPEGTGVIAGGPARAVIELAGIKNIRTKSLGSRNKQNVVLATIAGLSELKTPEEVARLRGKSTNEIFA